MGAQFSKKNVVKGGGFWQTFVVQPRLCFVTVELPDRSFKHTGWGDSCYATGRKMGILF